MTSDADGRRCDKCRWSVPGWSEWRPREDETADDRDFTCRRRAPSLNCNGATLWPTVYGGTWCGDFSWRGEIIRQDSGGEWKADDR